MAIPDAALNQAFVSRHRHLPSYDHHIGFEFLFADIQMFNSSLDSGSVLAESSGDGSALLALIGQILGESQSSHYLQAGRLFQ